MYVEDYNAEIDDKFVNQELKPYLAGVFADYALRSTPPSSSSQYPGKSIDKVTFIEYIQLPGIVSDRFYALARRDRTDSRIGEEAFISLMLMVFGSSLDEKMKFTFKM